jgi:hypothetical protein
MLMRILAAGLFMLFMTGVYLIAERRGRKQRAFEKELDRLLERQRSRRRELRWRELEEAREIVEKEQGEIEIDAERTRENIERGVRPAGERFSLRLPKQD